MQQIYAVNFLLMKAVKVKVKKLNKVKLTLFIIPLDSVNVSHHSHFRGIAHEKGVFSKIIYKFHIV